MSGPSYCCEGDGCWVCDQDFNPAPVSVPCENCDGRRCMACVLREIHGACIDDCPSCCPPPQPATTRLAAEADHADARMVHWRERALAAEARERALEETVSILLGLLPGVTIMENGLVVS